MVDRRLFCLLLGCIVGVLASAGARATVVDDFKVILLPDTQNYTLMPRQGNPYFAQTQWIKDNAAAENIRFVAHLGDIVQNREQDENEWRIADQAQAILEASPSPVPYSIAPGNHDVYAFGSPTYARTTAMYNKYFGVDRFEDQPWYGGHYGLGNDNNYSLFSVGNLDFLVMALEVMPSNGAIAWADQIIKQHPSSRVILTTHIYLKPDGTRYTDTIYHGITGNSGEQIYNKLVKTNPNIFLVACGHVCYEGLNVAPNNAGGQVYELLSDYQSLAGGGDGWLRVLDFSPQFNEISVRSYSPTLNQWDLYGSFTLAYDMGGTPGVPEEAVLRGQWSLDDGLAQPLGTTAADATGLGDPATLWNFASPPAWGDGQVGGALRFDGLNDRVVVDTHDDLRQTGAISVSLWANKLGRSRASYGELIGRNRLGDPTATAFGLSVDGISSKLTWTIQPSDVTLDAVSLTGNAALTQGEWRHVAAVFQPGWRMAIYVDGELDVELTAGVPRAINDPLETLLTLGNLDAGSGVDTYCFNGLLDEVRFYSGVLSDAQIAALAAQYEPLLPGDANRDGTVNNLDAALLASHWLTAGAGWAGGDFNRDGVVDDLDVAILAANWGTGGSPTVPEPAMAVLAFTLAVSLLAVNRRAR
ncbi:MAG: metallophosphoesterase [Pirellulales bacterium]|nr:metallophosphoesterase [Pirellulales bacterium]